MPPIPRIGTEFAGYRIEALLGRGGMGVVYRAEHPRLGTRIALKILAPELLEDEAFRERFVRESRVAAAINHPNIITIYDAGEWAGALYLAMRYVRGGDLGFLLHRETHLPVARVLRLTAEIGGALDAAHNEGLIHRDVKPANILLDATADLASSETAYLADFGLTKRAHSEVSPTLTGDLLGTIDYIAPEQIEGKAVGSRADLYSLGCVVFQCLTGEVPYRKENDAAVLWAHMQEEPPRATDLRPELPAGLDRVLAVALAKAPDERFPTCHDFVSGLQDALRGSNGGRSTDGTTVALARDVAPLEPVAAQAGGVVVPVSPRWRRTAKALAAVAFALLILVAAAFAGFVAARGGEPTAETKIVTSTRTVTISRNAGLSAAERDLLAHVPARLAATCIAVEPLSADFNASLS
jgi:serine/threonine protein kinase